MQRSLKRHLLVTAVHTSHLISLDWTTDGAEDSYQLPASAHHVDRSKELLLTRLCRCWGFLYRGPTVLALSSGQYWLFTLGALLRPGPAAGRDSHCQQLEPSRVQPGRPPSTGSRAGRVRAPMGGQHVWRMSGERSVVAAQPPPPDWHYRRLSGLSSTKEDGWLRNS